MFAGYLFLETWHIQEYFCYTILLYMSADSTFGTIDMNAFSILFSKNTKYLLCEFTLFGIVVSAPDGWCFVAMQMARLKAVVYCQGIYFKPSYLK